MSKISEAYKPKIEFRGFWKSEVYPGSNINDWQCSLCNEWFCNIDVSRYKYCPSCGKLMLISSPTKNKKGIKYE